MQFSELLKNDSTLISDMPWNYNISTLQYQINKDGIFYYDMGYPTKKKIIV